MKSLVILLVLVKVLMITSCGSKPDKSTNVEQGKDEEKPETISEDLFEIDTLGSSIPKERQGDNGTIDPGPEINAVQVVDEEAKPVNLEAIRLAIGYPSKAKDAGIEGSVIVRVLVGNDGEYMRHSIIKNAHPILTDAVASQVENLQFTPALKEGQAVKFWINLPFNFKLVR